MSVASASSIQENYLPLLKFSIEPEIVCRPRYPTELKENGLGRSYIHGKSNQPITVKLDDQNLNAVIVLILVTADSMQNSIQLHPFTVLDSATIAKYVPKTKRKANEISKQNENGSKVERAYLCPAANNIQDVGFPWRECTRLTNEAIFRDIGILKCKVKDKVEEMKGKDKIGRNWLGKLLKDEKTMQDPEEIDCGRFKLLFVAYPVIADVVQKNPIAHLLSEEMYDSEEYTPEVEIKEVYQLLDRDQSKKKFMLRFSTIKKGLQVFLTAKGANTQEEFLASRVEKISDRTCTFEFPPDKLQQLKSAVEINVQLKRYPDGKFSNIKTLYYRPNIVDFNNRKRHATANGDSLATTSGGGEGVVPKRMRSENIPQTRDTEADPRPIASSNLVAVAKAAPQQALSQRLDSDKCRFQLLSFDVNEDDEEAEQQSQVPTAQSMIRGDLLKQAFDSTVLNSSGNSQTEDRLEYKTSNRLYYGFIESCQAGKEVKVDSQPNQFPPEIVVEEVENRAFRTNVPQGSHRVLQQVATSSCSANSSPVGDGEPDYGISAVQERSVAQEVTFNASDDSAVVGVGNAGQYVPGRMVSSQTSVLDSLNSLMASISRSPTLDADQVDQKLYLESVDQVTGKPAGLLTQGRDPILSAQSEQSGLFSPVQNTIDMLDVLNPSDADLKNFVENIPISDIDSVLAEVLSACGGNKDNNLAQN